MTSSAPARRLTGQDAGPYTPGSAAGQKEDEAAEGSRRTSRPGPERGARVAAGLRPLTWTLPSRTLPLLHEPHSTTRTPDPLFILDTLTPLDTSFYYFCSIKASDTTPTVFVVCSSRHNIYIYLHLHFTFMHLADAFIQSDLHCIQVTVLHFYQLLLSLGIEPMILALLAPCSTI